MNYGPAHMHPSVIQPLMEKGGIALVYTDGSISKNPGGFGGWAAVIIAAGAVCEIAGSKADTTNNQMELMGPIRALQAIKEPSDVMILSDSQYVVLGFTEWLPGWIKAGILDMKKNADLWRELLDAVAFHKKVHWVWVRGHKGMHFNEEADRLAGEAMRSANPNHSHERFYSLEEMLREQSQSEGEAAEKSADQEQRKAKGSRKGRGVSRNPRKRKVSVPDSGGAPVPG